MTECILMSVYTNDCPLKFRRCIDSLDLNKSQIDLILCVDGSLKSELESIVQKLYVLDNVIILRGSRRVGLTKCLNKMIRHALNSSKKYELLFRMDADDICINDRFNVQRKFMKENLTIDVCGSYSCDIWSNGEKTVRQLPSTHEEIFKSILTRNPLKHSTICFRRKVFDLGFRYNEKFERCQDRVLWSDLIANGFKFHIIKVPLIKYINDDNFISRKKDWKAKKFTFLSQMYTLLLLRPVSPGPYIYFVALIISKFMPSVILKKIYRASEY